MLPAEVDCLGARVTTRLDEAIDGADVLIALRIQLERGAGSAFPSEREYANTYGDSPRRSSRGRSATSSIMHPGPINRGVEMSPDVADGPFSVILEQVEYGVACRMAILYLLSVKRDEETEGGAPAEGDAAGESAPKKSREEVRDAVAH